CVRWGTRLGTLFCGAWPFGSPRGWIIIFEASMPCFSMAARIWGGAGRRLNLAFTIVPPVKSTPMLKGRVFGSESSARHAIEPRPINNTAHERARQIHFLLRKSYFVSLKISIIFNLLHLGLPYFRLSLKCSLLRPYVRRGSASR